MRLIHETKHVVLRFKTGEADFSNHPDYEYYWENTVFGKIHE